MLAVTKEMYYSKTLACMVCWYKQKSYFMKFSVMQNVLLIFNMSFPFNTYDDRIDKVETAIAGRLRDQLGTAKSANKMFKYNSTLSSSTTPCFTASHSRCNQSQLI